eukprot:CAMPEP_0115003578 /NCGR_PEP_ID=MMETSP0216-20121206/18696_1 /TAXON_ID=223996 /ORGANISM="Protocruzia adherens, Strain Boccale" /LENGTH=744 /DNA_ID=CAMNT_0002369413 /DNA_START=156 /DNA_END=2390 /DNA_ORIENTATION=+
MSDNLTIGLLSWINTVHKKSNVHDLVELHDGIVLYEILSEADGDVFEKERINLDPQHNPETLLENVRILKSDLENFYSDQLSAHFPGRELDLRQISLKKNPIHIANLCQVVVGAVVQCGNKQKYIDSIMELDQRCQECLAGIIQKVMQGETMTLVLDQRDSFFLGQDDDGETMRLIENLKNERTKLEKTISDLRDENSSLSSQLEIATHEKQEMSRRIEELADEMDKRQQEYAVNDHKKIAQMREFENKELQDRLEEGERHIQELQAELSSIQGQHDEEMQALKDELDLANEKQYQMQKLEKTLDAYKKQLENMSSLKNRCEELEKAARDNDSKPAELDSSSQMMQVIQHYKEQVEDLKETISTYETESKERNNLMRTLELENTNLRHKKIDLEKRLREADVAGVDEETHESLAGLETSSSLQSMMAEDLQGRVKELERENKVLRSNEDFNKEYVALSDKHDDLQKEFNRLQRLHDATTEELKNNKATSNDSVKVSELEAMIEDMKRDRDNMNMELIQVKTELATHKEHATSMTTENTSNVEKIDGLLKSKEELQNLNHKLREEILDGKSSIAEATTQVSALSVEKQSLENRLQEKEKSEKLLQEEINILKSNQSTSQTAGESDRIRELEYERDDLRKTTEISNLKLKVREHEDSMKKMQDNIESLKVQHLDELKQQSSDLQTRLQVKDREVEVLTRFREESVENFMREEKLMTTVFYELGAQMLKKKVEGKSWITSSSKRLLK